MSPVQCNACFVHPVTQDVDMLSIFTLLGQMEVDGYYIGHVLSVSCLVMLVTKRDRWESTSQGRVMCEHY